MAFLAATNPFDEGRGIETDGASVFFVREDGTKLLLAAAPTELITDELFTQVGISGFAEIDCIVTRDPADSTLVFSLCDSISDETLETVTIPYDAFFITK